MGSQTLELKWENHKSNLTSELQELYLTDSLLDVTIACGEFSLKAHKTVLSASSTFFRKLFLDNPCKHPILIMTDINFGDLKTIMEFIYQGEIHISREKLTAFLKTAEQLKIKGLSCIKDMNLNQTGQSEIDIDSHYSHNTWEDASIQPQLHCAVEMEEMHNNPRQQKDFIDNGTNQEIPAVKLENKLSHSDNNICTYWQRGCFGQASPSSILPDCNLSSSSVSHQLSNPSGSHQLDNSSVSHQLPNLSVSHQVGVSLNGENFTYPEVQTDNRITAQVQDENNGRDSISVNLYHSHDQLHTAISTSTKSFEAVELLNNQASLQSIKTDSTTYDREDNCEPNTNLNYNEHDSSAYSCNFLQQSIERCVASERIQHNSNLKKFARTTCNCEFSINIQNHLRTISREKQTECNVCHKQFVKPPTLKNHQRTQTKEKIFECRVCHKRFDQQGNLQNHERIHTGEKPFECRVCHRRFTRKHHLQNHEIVHTGEKPFECRVCHKRFAWQHNLQIHERIHTGEKPFECRICHRKFTEQSSLKRHKTTHTRGKPF